jgi:hypothetical protein
MRSVPVANGSFLEVLGRFNSTPPNLQGLLPPNGAQMRAVLKFVTQVQAQQV